MKPFHILPVGTHTDSKGKPLTVDAAMLEDIASTYNATGDESPIVVGHPKSDAPAFGWGGKLTVEDGQLVVHPKQIHAQFAANVQNGLYRKRSIAFFAPNDPANPAPGHYYPRHFGFLGAAAPAIPGMEDVKFGAAEDLLTFEFAAKTPMDSAEDALSMFGSIIYAAKSFLRLIDQEKDQPSFTAPALTVTPKKDTIMETGKDTNIDFAAMEADLKTREDAVQRQEIEFAAAQAKTRADEDAAFIKGLTDDGKVPPAKVAGLTEFMAKLPHDEGAAFEFAAADGSTSKVSPRDYFKTFLQGAGTQIQFHEFSAEDEAGSVDVNIKNVDSLMDAAYSFQAKQKSNGVDITFDDALSHVETQALT